MRDTGVRNDSCRSKPGIMQSIESRYLARTALGAAGGEQATHRSCRCRDDRGCCRLARHSARAPWSPQPVRSRRHLACAPTAPSPGLPPASIPRDTAPPVLPRGVWAAVSRYRAFMSLLSLLRQPPRILRKRVVRIRSDPLECIERASSPRLVRPDVLLPVASPLNRRLEAGGFYAKGKP